MHRALSQRRRTLPTCDACALPLPGLVGLKPSDGELIDLQPQPLLAAWQRGDIDAAYVWLPAHFRAHAMHP
ncbi:hypothetical protein SPURM210S_03674 [Streptomyces purpurascens]